MKTHLELRARLLRGPLNSVVGRAPHPLLRSCPARQCAHPACSVEEGVEIPPCYCGAILLQWLHKANSSSYATAVCLVGQLSRCSACFCSPLWVHEKASVFLCQLLGLIYMPLGKRSRTKRRAFCAALSVGGFPVPFKSASLFSNSFTGERKVSDNGR